MYTKQTFGQYLVKQVRSLLPVLFYIWMVALAPMGMCVLGTIAGAFEVKAIQSEIVKYLWAGFGFCTLCTLITIFHTLYSNYKNGK